MGDENVKYVYAFKEGNKDMRELLGGKGANLCEMCSMGLPVPNGFIVTTEVCTKYYDENKNLSEDVVREIFTKLEELERESGKKLGDNVNPLLVSVRSGARESMPGMMDTILNLGMNDVVCDCLAKQTGNARFAYDSYRRLIQMYSDVVMGLPKTSFEGLFENIKKQKGVVQDTDLTSNDLLEIIHYYKREYQTLTGHPFPQDVKEQVLESIKAVFRSWNTDRAKTYRRLNHIDDNWGTAVNIQMMVYGNRGTNSGSGVCFSRNPATGEKGLFGEYLINAQGEDVVAGIRTPQKIETLKEILPNCYMEFIRISEKLEEHYKDMQDMEFTIEEGKLYILQTRNGKRTSLASVRIAVDLVNEGKISIEDALLRVDAMRLDEILHPIFEEESLKAAPVLARGLAASPGAAYGKICFTKEEIQEKYQKGERDLILVREETSPEDIEGMHLAKGILTLRGGMTSHAAVVARGMGKCCVSGCSDLVINPINQTILLKDGSILSANDFISLDGSSGMVYKGIIKTKDPTGSYEFDTFMSWARDKKKLGIRVNADTPRDAGVAKKFGAEGIGLCRTEHMFFDEKRIFNFRQMIIAPTKEKRMEALNSLLPYQKEDFIGLFQAMKGEAVIIRLLDPPLHEFLPKTEEEILNLAVSLGVSFESLKEKVFSLKEFNPMMGHRGCRLDVTYPEIAKMQARAIIEAAIEVQEENISVSPEIMIPLIGDKKEYDFVKSLLEEEIHLVEEEKGRKVSYKIGTMIEVPRAIVKADEIANVAEFFSFGTNDLTQLTFGFSRDDANKFLKDYYENHILENNPFTSIDEEGVGKLVDLATRLARKEKKNIELGICGEHGGDPKSIDFCHRIGLDYVSCSPYRIPCAILAAAQASIKANQSK